MFNALGFKNMQLVPEQCAPDGSFPTVSTPNPENADALQMGIRLADKTGAELVIGTDPDCDRMGAAVKGQNGEFITLTGNQLGCIMLEYRLRSLKSRGLLPKTGGYKNHSIHRACPGYSQRLRSTACGGINRL